MPRRPLRVVLPLVLLALVAASCGSGDDSADGGPATTATAEAVPDLGGLTMTDLTGGGEVALAEALDAPPSTPVLAFFWAPFCLTCRGEAPELEQFAREQQDDPDGARVVGVGALDDLAAAEDFRSDTGVESFPLLWSASTDTWAAFDVLAQPYVALIRDGEIVERWPGGATVTEIENAIERTA